MLVSTHKPSRDTATARAEQLERDQRRARDELTELAHTTTDYEALVQKKEAELTKSSTLLGSARLERDSALKQSSQLQARIDALTGDLQASESARKQGIDSRSRLEEEIDELRTLLQAKTSEETKRSEAEKSKELEISDLRARITSIQQSAVDARREDSAALSKAKVELESLQREHDATQDAVLDLKARVQAAEKSLSETTLSLQAAEKAKKTAETELHEFRSKHLDSEGQLTEALKAKEVQFFKIIVVA